MFPTEFREITGDKGWAVERESQEEEGTLRENIACDSKYFFLNTI